MCFDRRDDSTKHGSRNYVHFVQEYKPPFSGSQKLHHLLRFMRSVVGICNHRICGNNDTTFAGELYSCETFAFGEVAPVLTFSFWSAVKTAICRSVTFDHCMNCCFHCMTETLKYTQRKKDKDIYNAYDDVHKTRHDFLIVHAAVMPTSVFPAPQGKTMIPERARLHS